MKIIPLSEGAFSIDKTKQFIPFDIDKDNLQQRAVGSLLVEIQPFCIITDQDILIIDTGLGFCNEAGVMQIHQNLMNNNINPMEVTKVLLSHLHKDHAGGIEKKDTVLNTSFLSFPNATYYINRNELNYAFEKGLPSYITDELELLHNSDRIFLLNDKGSINDHITYEVTGAHSPYHMVYWIKEADQLIFFGGDVAPQLQQMKNRFVAKYDYDGKKAMELRQEWWKLGQEQNWIFLFYHDIKTPVFSFK
ncbi:MAG: MBL fold metallo-hydrolase [Ferruginibacter sp.]